MKSLGIVSNNKLEVEKAFVDWFALLEKAIRNSLELIKK